MSKPESISLLQARRMALAAQGFSGQRTSTVGRQQLRSLLGRLGAIQLDAVNALVRSHYLPAFSRLGHYQAPLLESLAWGSRRQRALFEYWGHEASLLPLELHPLLRWRMRRAARGLGIYPRLAAFGREQQSHIRRVLAVVEQHGALAASDLGKRGERTGTDSWWDWSREKQALEWLFATGRVSVATRRGFERVYDLPERVLPETTLAKPEPSEDEAQRQLLLRAADALGVATEADLRDYYRLEVADSRARLHELAEAAQLTKLAVRGWSQPAWCRGEPTVKRRIDTSALLSPFDSLIWSRERTERLFGFRYRLEIYTPAHRRTYGYYVLPFLHRERFAARVDLRSERRHARLAVNAVHLEPGGLDEEALEKLANHLAALANWLGLPDIALHCSSDTAARLRMRL